VVEEAGPASVTVRPTTTHAVYPLKPGDGVVFDAAGWRSPEEPEEGGRIFEIATLAGGALELSFARDAVQPSRIRPGDLLWRTDDPALERLLKPLTQAPAPVRKQPVSVLAEAAPGEPLRLTWTLDDRPALSVTVASSEPLAPALNRSLDEGGLRAQLDRLGPTPYALERLDLRPSGPVFAPASLLNQLRRDAVERLQALQAAPAALAVADPARAAALLLARASAEAPADAAPVLHLLVRTPDQLESAIALRPASITLDYLDLYGLQPSLELIRAAALEARVASPRILKPGEEKIAGFLLRLDCPLLVRPAGLLDDLRGRTAQPLTGDFSLNAANALSAAALLELGLERLTPTHDLNAAQVSRLARRAGGARIEAVAYQHLPVFHTEHCVFCRFLSTGTTYKDCGRPCETHRIELADPSGRRHPVLADTGCRNTVFGAQAQEASAHLAEWLDAGIRHFRLEFAHESPRQVRQVTEAFRHALSGAISFAELGERLRAAAPQGATQGSLYVPAETAVLPILR
jgi:putative protease